jgi:hypothetical protein
MLKYQNLANVGDRIRAYDFRGNKEAYIEGKVTAKGEVCDAEGRYIFLGYTINIEKDSVQEDFGREGDIGYVPFETTLDYDDRVELVDDDNRAEYELAIQMMKEAV